jgi:hypothetical protein
MDPLKYSFFKVKQDMDILQEQITFLNNKIDNSQTNISFLEESLKKLTEKIDLIIPLIQNMTPTHQEEKTTFQHIIPTHNLPLKPQKEENYLFSTGNGGVPADRQTNQQTNQHIIPTQKTPSFNESITILSSLDELKKEVKSKFKKITDQEFLVFSSIYQLCEQEGYTDYKALSQKLNLTESSIRDYVGKLIKKEIPLEKIKLNNKLIQLKISDNFRKIASLPVLLQLRGL